jgi:hypothetical protein
MLGFAPLCVLPLCVVTLTEGETIPGTLSTVRLSGGNPGQARSGSAFINSRLGGGPVIKSN